MPDPGTPTVLNVLKLRREKYLKQAENLAEQIRVLEGVSKTLGGIESDDLPVDRESGDTKHRVPVMRMVEEYIRESGNHLFTASELVRFIKSRGYQKVAYNSVYGTLMRQVEAEKLGKVGDKFQVKKTQV